MSAPDIDHPRAVQRLLDDGAVTVCTTPGCLAFVPGDTTEARALGWSIGTGEDDSVACPTCFALEHEATEWPTAEPPPDDCASDETQLRLVMNCPICGKPHMCTSCYRDDHDPMACEVCGSVCLWDRSDADDAVGWKLRTRDGAHLCPDHAAGMIADLIGVSDATVNADAIRAAVEAERAECAALLDGLADDATGEAQMALIRAARALRRRAIVRLP